MLMFVLRVRDDVRQNLVAKLVVGRLVRHEMLPDVLQIQHGHTKRKTHKY